MRFKSILAASVVLAGAACDRQGKSIDPGFKLSAPVTVKTDTHGIPHIYGQTDADVLFAQGYMMATLRPAQSEMFRLQSQGRSSEIFGEDALTEDLFIRSMGFYRISKQRWPDYSQRNPMVAEFFTSFAAGINRKYAEYRKTEWPMTIRSMDYVPADWTAEEVLGIANLLSFGLSGSIEMKLLFSVLLAALGPELYDDLLFLQPPFEAPIVPGFLDALGAAPAWLPAGQRPDRATADILRQADLTLLREPQAARRAIKAIERLNRIPQRGSNNMAVAGAHTASSGAIVESDTHQGMPTPNPYVQMHLISTRQGGSGTQDMLGASFPGAPGVVFGTNGRVAWAPTLAFADILDFYVEVEDDETKPGRVRRPGGSLAYDSWSENFRIRLEDGSYLDRRYTLRYIPDFGPILPEAFLPIPLPLKISVRWAGWHLDGPVPSVFHLSQARTVDDILESLRTYSGGSISFNAGDTLGDILYSAWTQIPVRPARTRHQPWFLQPAYQDVHWSGYLPMEQVPYSLRPSRGYVFSANHDPIGTTYDNDPANDAVYHGFVYASGDRALRLDTRLQALVARGSATRDDVAAIELDRYSYIAERLAPWLITAATRRPDLLTAEMRDAIDGLGQWNYHADPTSPVAAWFYPWSYQLVADMLLDDIDAIDTIGGNEMTFFIRAVLHWLEATGPILDDIDAGTLSFPSASGRNFFDDRRTQDLVETRDLLLLRSLRTALEFVRARTTDHSGPIQWGDIVRLRLRHDLHSIDAQLYEPYVREYPFGGNVDTVNVAQFKAYAEGALLDKFYVYNAPSNRHIWELTSDGVRGQFMWPGGQSEIPTDKHYLDLADDYIAQRYRAIAYSDAEIAAAGIESVIELR